MIAKDLVLLRYQSLRDHRFWTESGRGGAELRGRTFLVTGGNTGIGRATAAGLAAAGRARLDRGQVRGQGRGGGGRDQGGDRETTSVFFLPLDLADLDSVRSCASAFLALGEPLHVLVNNAGVAGQRGLTRQGFELTFGVNHLGHFALTDALLGCLTASAPARVVTVSSDAHYSAPGHRLRGAAPARARPHRACASTRSPNWPTCCSRRNSPAGRRAPGSPRTRCTRAWWRRTSGGGCRGRSARSSPGGCCP